METKELDTVEMATLSAPAKATNVSTLNYIIGNLYQWKP